MQGESFYYFQIANREQGNTNIAKADSIIQCVLFYHLFIRNLTTTQNLSFPFNYFEPLHPHPTHPEWQKSGKNTVYSGNTIDLFLTAENSQQITFI